MARVVSHREEFMRQAKQNIVDVVNHTAITIQQDAKASMKGSSRGGANPSKPGTPPNVNTARLKNSIEVDLATLAQAPVFAARVGSNVVYAPIHEFGGVIKASGPSLTVPVTAAARKQRRQLPTLRKATNLRHVPLKRGSTTGLLFDKKSGALWYVLKRTVVMPARPFLRPALKRAKGQFEKLLSGQLKLAKGFNPK